MDTVDEQQMSSCCGAAGWVERGFCGSSRVSSGWGILVDVGGWVFNFSIVFRETYANCENTSIPLEA